MESGGGFRLCAELEGPLLDQLAAIEDDPAELVPDGGTLLLLQADDIVLPPGIAAVDTADAVQMIGSRAPAGAVVDPRVVELTAADAPAMLELATLTRPGPFGRARRCSARSGARE